MSLRRGDNGQDPGYGSTSHPITDVKHVDARSVTNFVRGMARLMLMAADTIETQQRLPSGPEVHDVIEGEFKSR